MNLYLISQEQNDGWDTYDAAVVCAASEDEARGIHPSGDVREPDNLSDWCQPEFVKVELIGVAAEGLPAGVVLASFNAG